VKQQGRVYPAFFVPRGTNSRQWAARIAAYKLSRNIVLLDNVPRGTFATTLAQLFHVKQNSADSSVKQSPQSKKNL
jgi:hypothetical protein